MRRVNTYGNDKISTASTMFDFKPMKGGTAYHKAPDLGMDPLLAGSVRSNGNQNDIAMVGLNDGSKDPNK